MSPFEKQGRTATSCEPFSEWCELNGVSFSVKANLNQCDALEQQAWNRMLNTTASGDLEAANAYLAELSLLEYSDES